VTGQINAKIANEQPTLAAQANVATHVGGGGPMPFLDVKDIRPAGVSHPGRWPCLNYSLPPSNACARPPIDPSRNWVDAILRNREQQSQ